MITALDQSSPPGVAAITPEALNTLLVTVPLIIFSYNLVSYYAVVEIPIPGTKYLAVPVPDEFDANTPLLLIKFIVLR